VKTSLNSKTGTSPHDLLVYFVGVTHNKKQKAKFIDLQCKYFIFDFEVMYLDTMLRALVFDTQHAW
jgi:hypothetical protein